MDASTNSGLRLAQRSDAKAERPTRATLQRIATGISLVSLAVGFSILGTLIIMKRDQGELNGISGGVPVAMAGGISAILVGKVFLVIAYLYLWSGVIRSVVFPVRCDTARLTFSRTEPAVTIALGF